MPDDSTKPFDPLEVKRKSFMSLGKLYFWTATINSWQNLLADEQYKLIITSSLNYLSNRGLIDIYAFVIMPNHIHLIWRINQLNGKETPQGSFLKFTAHEFRKKVLLSKDWNLISFASNAANKEYEFWQRDSLAIHLYSPKVILQKMEYIHNNPVVKGWNLAIEPANYLYSSAKFYETGVNDFPFLKDIRKEL